ncbi:MAG: response regulator transcription factor, partial [Flavobacteriales bacterium]|nr:response regulator transcription factor [Flavobacteriales bacterium]
MRVLIVDDEPDARENLRMMIEEHCPELTVVGLAGSAREARELIAAEAPQGLFLDIKMPGEDGFELLHSLHGQDLPVVFTTAYDEYALQAFKENALDYLEKPVDTTELRRAASRLCRMAGDPAGAPQQAGAIAALLQDPASPLSHRMAVPGRDGLTLVKHEDILYLEASDSYTTIHTRDGKR